MTAKQRATRAGFTLVEILIVIGIIAVLASLLLVAIRGASRTAKVVQARNDITQLDTVLTKFKQDFTIYPPSHVAVTGGVARFMVPTHAVPNSLSAGLFKEQNDASYQLLARMFTRWAPATNTTTGQITDYDAAMANLAGKGLDPNQCLVFFLGGPNNTGFDTARPYTPTGSTKKGPFFDFPAGRLITVTGTEPDPVGRYSPGNGLPNFVDPWGVPYAYFSAAGDNYSNQVTFPLAAGGNNDSTTVGDATTAARTFTRPLRTGGKWINPGRCQIVSAGHNQLFGSGSHVEQTTPTIRYLELKPGLTAGYSEKDNGEDDLANFNEGAALGTSTNPN